MNDMKSIGTIISYKESTYMVIGYEVCDIDDTLIPHYVVVPIPLGYMNPESLRVIPINEVDTIIQDGYFNDFAKKYIDVRSFLFDGLTKQSPSEWIKAEEAFHDSIDKMEEHTDE
ncbi:protein of unknown function [Lachnospiraceae bacterium XBB2008]|nr:protein of unknown function [Lachnospiraceae bacterium XBB2008]